MPPYLDAPEGTTEACWRGTPLEIFRGRIFVPADAVPDLCAHGFRFSRKQEEDGDPASETTSLQTISEGPAATPDPVTPDPAAMTKAELRAFLIGRGQAPASATREDKLRAAAVALLAGE